MIELVIVSRLLEYPDAALWQHQQEMFEAIAASKNLSKEDAHALGIFLRDLTAMDPLDAQAQYSELFDRGRATSLLLFEHVHGESRDRGQAIHFSARTIVLLISGDITLIIESRYKSVFSRYFFFASLLVV